MSHLAIALDLGTSGLRAQALDLSTGELLSTAVTTRHPLPGANILDHVQFALEVGSESARRLLTRAVNQVVSRLRVAPGEIARLAVCGNPAQLSLLQGLEVRDLAYAGSRRLAALGVEAPDRRAAVRHAVDLPGLALPPGCEVVIPPAVRHEVGADALALIIEAGLVDCNETTIAIDYGTNAEMALAHEGRIYTGSAAAGPALEGQQITCGALASPGAIADLEPIAGRHQLHVLGPTMLPTPGALVDLRTPAATREPGAPRAQAVTGTGIIAALDQALEAGLVALPQIRTPDRRLHFGSELFLTEPDLSEIGKAIGAIRAGTMTLCMQAGIGPADIAAACLAGASGTYVDARKAGRLGLVAPRVRAIRQLGNTSLATARALALAPGRLAAMSDLADRLQETHSLFAASAAFTNLFLLELAYWTEGMPMAKLRELLRRGRLPDLPTYVPAAQVARIVRHDIGDLGRMGMVTVERAGALVARALPGCEGCPACVESCPTGALSVGGNRVPPTLVLDHERCDGTSCRRCERACPSSTFRLIDFFAPHERRAPIEHDAVRP
jgi:methylamine methyltransferase corrinoid protein reductive activase